MVHMMEQLDHQEDQVVVDQGDQVNLEEQEQQIKVTMVEQEIQVVEKVVEEEVEQELQELLLVHLVQMVNQEEVEKLLQ